MPARGLRNAILVFGHEPWFNVKWEWLRWNREFIVGGQCGQSGLCDTMSGVTIPDASEQFS